MAPKKDKKASRVNDIITRDYTINMHKRLMGQYVPCPRIGSLRAELRVA